MHEIHQHRMSTRIDPGAVVPFAPSSAGLWPASTFGTLQAPVFSALKPGTFSHLQVEAILEAPAGAALTAEAMFRQQGMGSRKPIERSETAQLQSLELKFPMSTET